MKIERTHSLEEFMQLDDFLGFQSQDEAVRERSFAIFNEAIADREFILQLFEHLKSELPQNVRFLVESAILRVLEIHFKPESTFWDPDAQNHILDTLVEYSLSIPYENSRTAMTCVRHIIMNSPISILQQVANYYSLLETHQEQQQVLIILQIMLYWTKLMSVTPLSQEETENILQEIEEFNVKLVQTFIEITNSLPENLIETPFPLKILRIISKCMIALTSKSVALLTDASFDTIIGAFMSALQFPSQNLAIIKLKRSITRFFIILCKYFIGVDEDSPEEDIRNEYAKHFQSEVAPQFLEMIIYVLSNETDDILRGNVLFLLSQLLFHQMIPVESITSEFVSDVIIRSARLTPDIVNERIINPQLYIAHYLHYSANELINRRRGCAKVIEALVKKYGEIEGIENKYIIVDMLYELLLAATTDPYEFESRIYLMTRYIRDTNTPMGPMVDPAVIEALTEVAGNLSTELISEEAKNATIDRTFVLASLLMMMRHTLPYMDPNIGLSLAVKCIMESPDEVVITCAAKLARACIDEGDIPEADFNVIDIIKKLLEYLHTNSPAIPMCVRSMLKIGGPQAAPLAKDVITDMLSFCVNPTEGDESDDNLEKIATSFTSTAEIIASLAHDQGAMAETAAQVTPMVAQYFVNHPQTKACDEILYFIAQLNTKCTIPIPAVYSSCTAIANIIAEDEVYLQHAEQITCALCPLILLNGEGCEAERFEFNNSCFKLCNNILQFCNRDASELSERDRAYALILSACMVQAIGEPAVIFLPAALEAITLPSEEQNDSLLYSSATTMIVSCFIASPEQTAQNITEDLANYIRESVNAEKLPTYNEFKLSFALLLYLARAGHQNCYVRAAELIKTLCEMRAEEENMAAIGGDKLVESMILPFSMPVESINELELFGQLTDQYFNSLPAKLKKLVKSYFHI